MRVTTHMIQTQIFDTMSASQEKLLQTQTEISSTKEVVRSSDDPTRYDRSSRFRSLATRNDRFVDNIEDGLGWVVTSTSTLESVYEQLAVVHDKGLRSRNDFDASARLQAGNELNSFLEEIVSLSNTDHLGKFIYGGTKTEGTPPFTFDGATATYNGNTGALNRKIGETTLSRINVTGDTFLSAITAVIALRDGMLTNDNAAMDAAIETLDAGMIDVLATASNAGSQQRRLELTKENLQVANINLQSYISQAEDVDLSEAILRFNSQELGFRAALESSTRIQNITILDYIR